jgi:hypothetical protein
VLKTWPATLSDGTFKKWVLAGIFKLLGRYSQRGLWNLDPLLFSLLFLSLKVSSFAVPHALL